MPARGGGALAVPSPVPVSASSDEAEESDGAEESVSDSSAAGADGRGGGLSEGLRSGSGGWRGRRDGLRRRAGGHRIYACELGLSLLALRHLAPGDHAQEKHRGGEAEQSHQDDKSAAGSDFKTHPFTHIRWSFLPRLFRFSPES